MAQKIPCTIALLTHNSAATLPRALESVKQFAEILICDGGSTDATLAIAQTYVARIIEQSKEFLDDTGRIINFAGVRNQTLEAATQTWFFFIDSDEYIEPELAEEIEMIIKTGNPAAYFIPRLYVLDGQTVCCASTYPNQQMRFFHRDVVTHFIKQVHERIELKEGVFPLRLVQPMFVPLSHDPKGLRRKWRYYLDLEDVQRSSISFRIWASFAVHQSLIAVLYCGRYIRGLLWCRGKRLPLTLELPRLWYQYEVVRRAFSAIKSW